ncbi:hypothetical protein LTR53_015991 [Teratosphaeriaceae sp. CCFEE 6253]|nr:hypothetical protein LTR53_015991 [Teratosphaeriaceae sp. CCFEE 6253]
MLPHAIITWSHLPHSPPHPPLLDSYGKIPPDDAANKGGSRSLATRRRVVGPSPVSREHGRTSSSEWTDIEESPPRRRRSSKRRERAARDPDSGLASERSSQSELSRFFPRLGRILESSESATNSRPSTRGSDTRRQRDRSPARRRHHRDDASTIRRRPAKHRTSGVQRRSDSLLKANLSLLSVSSGLTATTDRSSGSSSTITQQSYNRGGTHSSGAAGITSRRMDHTARSKSTRNPRARSPDVFAYMTASTADEEHAGRSIMSSSSSSASSRYEPSLAGSSEAPDTPSSRSTFPSPTNTRSHSVAELRQKYDPHYATTSASARATNHSPGSSVHGARRQPSVDEGEEEDDHEQPYEHAAPSEPGYGLRQRSTSRSSRSSQHSDERMSQQEAYVRQHMAYGQPAHPAHYIEPVYGQHRSASASSTHSSPYAYNMAVQQYQWPSPPGMSGRVDSHYDMAARPPAPDAPDLTKRTLAGYEMLAVELSTSDSHVRPLYRRFEYLHHRILLHVQDELCELEEQLRTMDEIIAQMDPALPESPRTPASRRGEAYQGAEIHHQRTQLLGRIFLKTEQYSRAMTAYAGAAKCGPNASSGDLEAYRVWMEKHSPVHFAEAQFLQREDDLVAPGGGELSSLRTEGKPTKHAAQTYLPVALVLPLLLFSFIPSLAGRLAITALIAAAAFTVVETTQVRHLLSSREWAVCVTTYVLLMTAIAGCIPRHAD